MKCTKYSLLVTFIQEGEAKHHINKVVVDSLVSHDRPRRGVSSSTYKSFVMVKDKLTVKNGSVNGQYVGAHFEIYIDANLKPQINIEKEIGEGRKIYFRLLEEEVDLK